MKLISPFLCFVGALLVFLATSSTIGFASATSKTSPTIPPRSLKESTTLKLEKILKVVGGWVEFRQIATDGRFIYVCSSAASLSKYDMDEEKHMKTTHIPGGIDLSLACTYSNGYVYTLGRRDDNRDLPSVLWRYNSSTMEIEGPPLEIPGDKVRAWQMTADDDFLYLPILAEPARVLRVRLNPFEHDLTITFASGENYASAITFDDTREHIYVATHNPALIKKISAATMEEVDTAVLNYTQDNGYVRLDQDGHFIYCAVSNGYASVVKVDMDLMEVVAVSNAGTKEMGNGVVVSDRGAGILHVGNIELGFSWLKVDATAGDDGEDMVDMGTEVKFKEEPANRMKYAMIIKDKVWVANGRGHLLRFGPVVSGGPLAYTFNNKYLSGEPKHIEIGNKQIDGNDDDDGQNEETGEIDQGQQVKANKASKSQEMEMGEVAKEKSDL